MLVNRSVLTSIYSNRQNQTNITVFQKFEITQKTEIARERSTIGRRVLTRGACVDPMRRLKRFMRWPVDNIILPCANVWSTQGVYAPTRELCADPMRRRMQLCADSLQFRQSFALTRELWADPYGRLKAFKSAKKLWLVILYVFSHDHTLSTCF